MSLLALLRPRWRAMIRRCHDSRSKDFVYYGGRGIIVCDRWRVLGSGLANFAADVGAPPGPAFTLDRFPDPNGPYAPGNVRWATWGEQRENQRGTHLVTLDGETHSVAGWARRLGLRRETIDYRLARGWSIERALLEAPRPNDSPVLTLGDETRSLSEWADKLGITTDTLGTRLRRGWSVKRALETRVRGGVG